MAHGRYANLKGDLTYENKVKIIVLGLVSLFLASCSNDGARQYF